MFCILLTLPIQSHYFYGQFFHKLYLNYVFDEYQWLMHPYIPRLLGQPIKISCMGSKVTRIYKNTPAAALANLQMTPQPKQTFAKLSISQSGSCPIAPRRRPGRIPSTTAALSRPPRSSASNGSMAP